MRALRYERLRVGAAPMTTSLGIYVRTLSVALLVFGFITGCGIGSNTPSAASPQTEPPPPPPPPDVGDIVRFHSCEAKARRKLSARDQCQIEKLAARCTAADDCLVSCISSPQGYQVGGGCSHVCFFGPHPGEGKPQGWSECDALPSDH